MAQRTIWKVKIAIQILTLFLAGCATPDRQVYIGPGTEDVVYDADTDSLYVRTTSPPLPFLDRLFSGQRPPATIWRVKVADDRITHQESVRKPGFVNGLRLSELPLHYKPLALYLHPTKHPTELYALNPTEKSPGVIVIPLDEPDGAVRFVPAKTGATADFSEGNCMAVHPDGRIFVSLFRPFKILKSKTAPVATAAEARRKNAYSSVIMFDPRNPEAGWQTVLWNVGGANGMAFWTNPSGGVELILSDYSHRRIWRFEADEDGSLRTLSETSIQFRPDNLTISGDELFIAGQYNLISSYLNISFSSGIPTRSGILRWSLSKPDAEPVLTDPQPQGGPAVATAVPYHDFLIGSHITAPTLRLLNRNLKSTHP